MNETKHRDEETEVLTKDYWHAVRNELKALKEQVSELDKLINEGDTTESSIQLLYEGIIPRIEDTKEYLFKILALEEYAIKRRENEQNNA